jgi:drug/metabolite transporter (DMT)-like permease
METPQGRSLPHPTAVVYLVLAAVLWSTSGVAIKVLDWQPVAIWSGRGAVAFVVFLLYLRRIRLQPSAPRVVGGLCYIAMQLLFITATQMTTAANAILLQYTAPLYVVVLAYVVLRERPQRIDGVAMVVIFVGMAFFFGDELSLGPWGATSGPGGAVLSRAMVGNGLALLSGIALAGMNVALRAQRRGSPAETIMLGHLVGAVVGLPWLLRETFTWQSVAIIAFLGIIQTGAALIFYSAAIQHVGAVEASLILTLEPILNPIWVFLVVGETPGPLSLVGGALVVGAVVVRALSGARAAGKRALGATRPTRAQDL